MEIIYFNPLCKARSALASCPGTHPVGFWMSPRAMIQSLSALCVLAFKRFHCQTVFLLHIWHFLHFIFCPLFFVLSLDTIETWLSLLYSFSSSGTFNIARILMFPSKIVSAISDYPCITHALIPLTSSRYFSGLIPLFCVLYWGAQNYTQ